MFPFNDDDDHIDDGLTDVDDSVSDFSTPDDHSDFQDYSSQYDNTDQPSYHHGPVRREGMDAFNNRQSAAKSMLLDGEKSASKPNTGIGGKTGNTNNNGLDIGKQERSSKPSNNNWNYNNTGSGKGGKNGKQDGNFAQRHQKGIIGWIIGIVMGGGVFGMGSLVSGPMQFLQLDNLIRDKIGYFIQNTVIKRVTRNISSFARGTNQYSINGTKMGILSDRIANKRLAQLGERGVTFTQDGSKMMLKSDSDLARAGGRLDDIVDGSEDAVRAARRIADDMGIDERLVRIVGGAAEVDIGDMTSFSKRLKTLNKMNDVGRFDIIGRVKTRILNKKLGGVGSISWFHPIKKLKAKVNKLISGIKDRFAKYLTRKLVGASAERAAKKAVNQAVKEAAEQGTELAAEEIERIGREAAENALEEGGSKVVQFVTKKVLKQGAAEAAEAAGDVVKKGVKIGFVSLAVDIIDIGCMIEELDDTFGMYQMMNIVAVAMQESQTMQSTSSQIMAGFENYDREEDLAGDCENMTADEECVWIEPAEQLGFMSKQKLYNDEIQLVGVEGDGTERTGEQSIYDENGNVVGTEYEEAIDKDSTTFSGATIESTTADSVWNSAPLKALNNETYDDQNVIDTVPMLLTTVGSSKNMFSTIGKVAPIVNSIVGATNSVLENKLGDLVCDTFNSFWGGLAMNVIGIIVDVIINAVTGGVSAGTATVAIMATVTVVSLALIPITMWLKSVRGGGDGGVLAIDETTTPSQYGSINAYGAVYSNNASALNSGGRELRDDEVAALWNEQRQYLAEQWNEKPWYAKLLDPTDYRSTANVIARAANFDISSQDPVTQLGNVVKFFGALPKLFGAAVNQIGGVAYAADALPFGGYDFGVPIYGYSDTEQESIVVNDAHDIFENTEEIKNGNLLSKYEDKLKKCFAVKVKDAASLDLEAMDNSDGSAWDYIRNGSGTKTGDDKGRNYGDCGDTNAGWLRVRIYVLDYFNMLSDDCYWSTSGESCEEIFPDADL